MVRRVTIIVFLALGLLAFAVGCQGKLSTVEPTATHTLDPTEQAIKATELAMRPTETATYTPPPTSLPTDTPEPSPTPLPTTPPPDTATATATLPPDLAATGQVDSTNIAQAVAATLAAQPSSTPYPTYTPYPSPSLSDTLPPPTGTSSPDFTATAWTEAIQSTQIALAVEATVEARPSLTPYLTTTPVPSLPSTETLSPDFTATAQAEAAQATETAAEIAAGVEATLAAQPSATIYPTYTAPPLLPTYTQIPSQPPYPTYTAPPPLPTYTPVPSATPYPTYTLVPSQPLYPTYTALPPLPTYTRVPSATPYPTYTLVPSQPPYPTYTALPTYTPPTVEALPEDQAQATAIADAVQRTLAAQQPSATPYPTYTLPPSVTPYPTYTAQPSATPYPTYTLPPSATPYPTYTIQPSVTPSPTYTSSPFVSPTVQPSETLRPDELTATRIIADATATAVAWLSATPTVVLSPTITRTPSPTYTPSPAWDATATQIVVGATATAAAPQTPMPGALGVTLDVPEGWSGPQQRNANTLYLTDGTAHIYTYRGDAAFFAAQWDIPVDVTNLQAAADALALTVGGTVAPYEVEDAALILVDHDTTQGAMYLLAREGEWVLVSASAPADEFEVYRADVFDPLVASLETTGPLPLQPTPVMLPVTPSPAQTLGPSFTPTLNPFVQTSTQFAVDMTNTATVYVTPTARPTNTPRPTSTSTPSPTYTPSPAWDATATQAVLNATATATMREALDADAFGLVFDVPDGWSEPQPLDTHTLYLTDEIARVFIYRGAGAYVAARWGIPADETDLQAAAEALNRTVEGTPAPVETEDVALILVDHDTTQGAVYLVAREGEWVIVSTSAPADEFETYRADVFDPLVASLEVGAALPMLVPYENESLGLVLDIPADWTPWIYDDLNEPDLGVSSVIFYSNPGDISEDIPSPTAPAILLLHMDFSVFMPGEMPESPEDMLITLFELEPDAVRPYPAALYPTARGMIEDSPDEIVVVYALQLGDDDWLFIALLAPPDENIMLLDEIIAQPMVRSVRRLVGEEAVEPETPTPSTPVPDADGDGIPDGEDACPNDSGPEENDGCPWLDTDGDGVLDKDDVCPTDAGVVENEGCPWPDSDGDGVLDPEDACPDEAGSVSNAGCPPDGADAFVLGFDVPDGWSEPQPLDAHTLYLTDEIARVFIYRGDGAYVAAQWGIPADETDLQAAAEALNRTVEGTSAPVEAEDVALILVDHGTTQGAVYLVALDGEWVIVSASAPVDEFETYRADVFDPLVTSLEVGAALPMLVPYENESLGLALDVPADWTPWIYDDLNDPDLGISIVIFFSNPDDITADIPAPTAPAVLLLRIDSSVFMPGEMPESPEDMLATMFELEPDAVRPYPAALYPAARGRMEDSPDEIGVVYALQLGDDDWLFIALLAPPDENIMLLDEIIAQPVVRSVRLLGEEVGEPETLTPDSDGDGIPDGEDVCPDDVVHDVVGDPCDHDEDGDGIADEDDLCPFNAIHDDVLDPCTNDEDDDGILDEDDPCPFDPVHDEIGDPCEHDEDTDGIADDEDECPLDPLNDEVGDPCEHDEDDDGILDDEDVCPFDADHDEIEDPCNHDEDGDGIVDTEDECPLTAVHDEIGDPCKLDEDDDGVLDRLDDCPDEAGPEENDGCPWPDSDGDGVLDRDDACPYNAAPDVEDGCPPDADVDGDGLPNVEDACPYDSGPEENDGCPWPDGDTDGIPDQDDRCPNTVAGAEVDEDGCVADSDADGILNAEDPCPFDPENDEIGNPCDHDEDNDGVLDPDDACPDEAGPADNGGCPEVAEPADADGDGVTDDADACLDTAAGADVDETGCSEEQLAAAAPEPEMGTVVAVVDASFALASQGFGMAELRETLEGEGPYTVFAPTDEAFLSLMEMLPVERLMTDTELIKSIFNYHIVPGKLMVADLTDGTTLTTLSGEEITVTVDEEGNVILNGMAKIVASDLEASNGVIHGIDHMLLPPGLDLEALAAPADADGDGIPDTEDPCVFDPENDEVGDPCDHDEDNDGVLDPDDVCPTEAGSAENAGCAVEPVEVENIVETLGADGRFSMLMTVLSMAGMEDTLRGEGPFTVFAPTDDALNTLMMTQPDFVEQLLADPEVLGDMLLYHVVPGKLMAADVAEQEFLGTVQGADLAVSVANDGVITLNDTVTVIEADILASNGVIHVIDGVLLPPPTDADGDGFTDDVDACPNEAAPESEDGCPISEGEWTLVPYENADLGVMFEAPAEWIEWVDETLNASESGLMNAFLYEKPEDVGLTSNPSGPVLMVLRMDLVKMGMGGEFATPEEFLANSFGSTPDQVTAFDTANFPAARLVLDRTDDNGVLYVLQFDNDIWLLMGLLTPSREEALRLDETLMQPLVRSVELFEPVEVGESDQAELTLVPYENADLGVMFEAPADWVEWVDATMNVPEAGLASVYLYANAADVGRTEDPVDPMLLLLRMDLTILGMGGQFVAPEDFLAGSFDVSPDQVNTYDLANYPAARLMLDETTEGGTVLYALQLGTDDWLLIGLLTPLREEALRLDETILQPLVRSVQLIGEDESAVPPAYPFAVQDGTPIFRENFANAAGCDWQGIAGQTVTEAGEPVLGLAVRVTGEDGTELAVFSGTQTFYGPSGWEVMVGTAPDEVRYEVQLGPPDTPLSPPVEIVFSGSCQENLALINFVQVGPY